MLLHFLAGISCIMKGRPESQGFSAPYTSFCASPTFHDVWYFTSILFLSVFNVSLLLLQPIFTWKQRLVDFLWGLPCINSSPKASGPAGPTAHHLPDWTHTRTPTRTLIPTDTHTNTDTQRCLRACTQTHAHARAHTAGDFEARLVPSFHHGTTIM